MMRFLIVLLILCGSFARAQSQPCDIKKDSVLNVLYRNYQLNYIQGEKWKAAALGQQILRKCPNWKPEIYRELGSIYQSLLDTILNVDLRMRIRDTMYHVYQRAAVNTGDSAHWYLLRGMAALKYEDQSDSILALMLEPAIRLQSLNCPPHLIEDYFRILDWKTRRRTMDSLTLELWYQKLNVILARQFLLRDSIWEKEHILKVKKNMAFRMARYLPDSALIAKEAGKLKSNQYTDWLRIYARLFARNINDPKLTNFVKTELIRTGTETVWAGRYYSENSGSPEDWKKLISLEKDTVMKAWFMIQAAKSGEEKIGAQSTWQLLENARNTASDYGAPDMEMARFLLRVSQKCTDPNEAVKLKHIAVSYYFSASQKEYKYRNQARIEMKDLPENRHPDLVSGEETVLNCPDYFRIINP